jgi:quercetin 2,3-dioxygenase
MVQLWVNLSKKYKSAPAHYQAITADKMGKVELPDNNGQVNVIAGQFNGVQGPANTYSPVNLFDIKLKKGGEATITFPENYNTALLVINGSIEVNNEKAAEHSFVLFKNEGDEITLRASEDSVVLILSGEPINEPIASYGPFVMNTQEEIYEAIEEFQSGKFGALN